MSVIAKALELLEHFTASRPEIGLSQFRRIAKHDKATTYRYLQALEQAGFVEQNPLTKAYRIGPAVLHLAQMRELTVPRKEGAREAIDTLAAETGETAHLSVLSGTTLHALLARESDKHGIRAIIDIRTLPLHATASGNCALAFGPEDLFSAALQHMVAFTPNTTLTEDQLRTAVETARETGFGYSYGGLEQDVVGLAAPVFDETGLLAGTVAVASVASRMTPEAQDFIKTKLAAASREITHRWGGVLPATLQNCWSAMDRRPQ
ncbi:IclR family transcriptional regulator [Thalassovita sp.]|uniref:IclR family transcriptional regulator n=1 Tax=Thalassovita sp. TaxID=1979401 RepID=UPI0029DE6C49|nr:IclR family transcriptional regulator [Thalassovita sp.]